MKGVFKSAFIMAIVLIVLCGVVYPLAVTGVSQLVFNDKANGSLVELDGKVVGSQVIGQKFDDDKFFKGGVSAYNYNTYKDEDKIEDSEGKVAYAGVGSGSANLASSNPALTERVEKDIEGFLAKNEWVNKEDIPTDLLTSSGSGLDPHISVESAKIQVKTVAKNSGISEAELNKFIEKHTEGKTLGILGEERVNVLLLNLEIVKALK